MRIANGSTPSLGAWNETMELRKSALAVAAHTLDLEISVVMAKTADVSDQASAQRSEVQ